MNTENLEQVEEHFIYTFTHSILPKAYNTWIESNHPMFGSHTANYTEVMRWFQILKERRVARHGPLGLIQLQMEVPSVRFGASLGHWVTDTAHQELGDHPCFHGVTAAVVTSEEKGIHYIIVSFPLTKRREKQLDKWVLAWATGQH